MLGFFRRMVNSKVGVIVTFAVLAIIALAFAAGDVTGLGHSAGGGGISGSNVATVGGRGIGVAEFKARVQDEYEGFRQQNPSLTMAQYVAGGGADATLDRMLNGLALEAFGHSQDMVVSKAAVDGQLTAIPGLQNPATGKFDQALYENILRQRRLTDAQIRGDIARTVLGQALVVPTIGASQVPQSVALPYANLLLERRSGQLAFIPTAALTAGKAPADAELQQYYQRNIARYTLPERRVIRYARVIPEQVQAQAVPSPQEIQQAYNANRAAYAPSEQRDVTQVTVLDQAGANALAAKVRGGTSLADAARAAGLEARTLTGVKKAAYAAASSPALADAVFAAAPNSVVGPQRGGLGFVVARVDKVAAVPGRTLEQVRGEITATLGKQKQAEALGRIQDALNDAASDNANFNEMVTDQKLTAQATPALLPSGINPDNPQVAPDPALAPIVAAAFQAEEGDAPQVVATAADGSFAVVALDRVVHATPRLFAQVREDVSRDFVTERAARAARQVAASVMNKVNKGTPLREALAQTNLTLPSIRPLAAPRAQLAANPRGAEPPLVLLFSMAPNTAKLLAAPNDGGWYVVRLDQVQSGDARRQPGVIQAARADLAKLTGREYVEQFTTAASRAVGVKRNAAALAQAKRELLGQGGSAE